MNHSDSVSREWDAGVVTDRPDRAQLELLRAAWVDERSRMTHQVESLGQRFDDIVAAAELTSTDDEHDPEGATIAYERAQVWALLQQARIDLSALDDALGRLDPDAATSDTCHPFGGLATCRHCEGPIDVERLLALPGVRTCISCAR